MGKNDRKNETTIETIEITNTRTTVVRDLIFRNLRDLTICFERDVFETKIDRRLKKRASDFCSNENLDFFTVSRIFGALMLVSKAARFFFGGIFILSERGVDEGEKRLHEKKRGERIIKKSRWKIDGISSSQHNQHVATKGAISGASHMPI